MFDLNPLNTPDITFIAKAIYTIYEANAEGLELQILEVQNKLTIKAYNLDKSLWKLVEHTDSIAEKVLKSRQNHTLDKTVCVN